jgi:hypothetical protein
VRLSGPSTAIAEQSSSAAVRSQLVTLWTVSILACRDRRITGAM